MTDSDRPTAGPLVSIGLPVYNGDTYLEGAIRSLLGQNYRHTELVISDNASTDKTEQICREYAAQDSRVRYSRSQRNVGIIRNFQRVFSLSQGPFFMWAAHDDQWAPTFVSELLKPLASDPACVASFCHYDIWYRRETTVAVGPGPMPSLSLQNTAFDNLRQLLLYPQSPLFYGLFRRTAIERSAIVRDTYFDWGDIYYLQQLSVMGRMSMTDSVLFHSGVPNGRRAPKSLAPCRLPGFRYAHSPYLVKTARLIARATDLSMAQKARLTLLLLAEASSFFRHSEPILRPLATPLRLWEKVVAFVDRQCSSNPADRAGER